MHTSRLATISRDLKGVKYFVVTEQRKRSSHIPVEFIIIGIFLCIEVKHTILSWYGTNNSKRSDKILFPKRLLYSGNK